jgi:HAD superfamily hydrolase (TIGR01549 family)
MGGVPDQRLVPVFDFDGTLVDSDAALRAPFARLGVDPDTIPLGLPAGEACDLAGVSLDAYLECYDTAAVAAFPGVDELLVGLPRWALCSNKARRSAGAELVRLGWTPEVALFSEDFGGGPKRLSPVLDRLGLPPDGVVFIGDTDHDRACATAVGATFALAGWNARTEPRPGDVVLATPGDVRRMVA